MSLFENFINKNSGLHQVIKIFKNKFLLGIICVLVIVVIIFCVILNLNTKRDNTDIAVSVDSVIYLDNLSNLDTSQINNQNNKSEHQDVIGDLASGINSDFVAVTDKEDNSSGDDAGKADYWGYKNLGIANVSNHLNIRSIPSEDGKMLGKMSNNDACEILEMEGNWAHVITGEVEGYVCLDYLLTGPLAIQKAKEVVCPVATITSDAVRVREEANTDCAVITLLKEGEELNVIEQQGDWYQIDLDDEIAYVYADYVSVEEKLSVGVTMEELYYGNGVSDTRIELCKYAQQFIGNPYVWGGTSLTNGADCSGFTMSVYAHFGVKIPHHSGSQAKQGRSVPLANVRPGDLIFYTRGGVINHVAIYIGNGQVCHASSPKTGIKVSNMYYRTPYKAVSLLD